MDEKGKWADFNAYCKGRWGFSRDYADTMIVSAELRLALPALPTSGRQGWTEGTVRGLKRLGSLSKAKAVASRVVKEVEAKQRAGETPNVGRIAARHVRGALSPPSASGLACAAFSVSLCRPLAGGPGRLAPAPGRYAGPRSRKGRANRT